MRKLFLTRGATGCGKSTFLEDMGLLPYTINPDILRLFYNSPRMNELGKMFVFQQDNSDVWKMTKNMVEHRMKNGDTIIVDAMHSLPDHLSYYKDLAKEYRYRVYIIDFSHVPIELVKQRNRKRECHKQVPDFVIERVYKELEEDLPGFVEAFPFEEAEKHFEFPPLDFSQYKKIHHVGDLHGSLSVLFEYLNGRLKDDELYIFTGDYIDRGIENAELLEFLYKIKNKPNVILLEGNHEIHLWKWANGERSYSRFFETVTKPELESKGIKKSDMRSFYRKLRQIAYYTYRGKTVLVTHGGLPCLPENLIFMPTSQLINGVGGYDVDIDGVFEEHHCNDSIFQIHGHRNLGDQRINAAPHSFNLEGKVEYGGDLRVVTLSQDGFEYIAVPNKVYSVPKRVKAIQDVASLLRTLRECEDIKEKIFGNISSFNFTQEVFYSKAWNFMNIKARGLFINTKTEEIVARAYEKFANIEEIPATRLVNLPQTLTFPVTAYVKENGYLGMVGYDSESQDLVFASKSLIHGTYAQWLEDIVREGRTPQALEKLKAYLKAKNMCLALEVIDPLNDPHIIENDRRKVILLDVIKRQPVFEKLPYEGLQAFGCDYGFEVKERMVILENYGTFEDWYYNVTQTNYRYKGNFIEGFVIEDAKGYMVKVKLAYYQFWKSIRSLVGRIDKIDLERLEDSEGKEFLAWVEALPAELQLLDIISLRNKYLSQKQST